MKFALNNLKKGIEFYDSPDNLTVLAKAIQRTPNETLKLEVRDKIKDKINSYEEGEPEREKLQAKYYEMYLNKKWFVN